MKKFFTALFVLFALSITPAIAQGGNLQFNQVIVYELDGQNPTAFTVPADKVWKIESASSGYYSSTVYLRNTAGDFLATLYSSNLGYRVHFPYWLPSNFSGDFIRYGNVSSGPKSTISIIEFNVIP